MSKSTSKAKSQRNTAIGAAVIIILFLLLFHPFGPGGGGGGTTLTTTLTTTSNGSTITTIVTTTQATSTGSTLCSYCGPNTLFRVTPPQITPSTISVGYGSSVQVNVQAGVTGTVQLNGATFGSITPNGYQTIMPGQAVTLTGYFNPSLLTHGTYFVSYWAVDQNGNRISSTGNYSIGL